VRAVHEKRFGHMVAVRGTKIVTVPIAEAVGAVKRVSPASELVWTARSMGISFGADVASSWEGPGIEG
jgi:6-phosphofructokinase 1